jgi:putative oxidoreductase
VGEEEQMNPTPDAQPARSASRIDAGRRSTLNIQSLGGPTVLNDEHQKFYILWRILDFVLAGVFIFAGFSKMFDLDHLVADLLHLRFGDALVHLRQLSPASPVEFANGIDNFKLVPWPVSVALAFYLPWLEIFCALALVFRFFYRGALTLLITLITVFTLAITAAKLRGLDITCGCFGHASQHWSFPSHLATNLAILAGLIVLSFSIRLRKPL